MQMQIGILDFIHFSSFMHGKNSLIAGKYKVYDIRNFCSFGARISVNLNTDKLSRNEKNIAFTFDFFFISLCDERAEQA